MHCRSVRHSLEAAMRLSLVAFALAPRSHGADPAAGAGSGAGAGAKVILTCQEGPVLGASCNCSASVTASVPASAALMQWIKIERTDGCADGRHFPLWVSRAWGWQVIAVEFMGSSATCGAISDPAGTVPLVASGWSARWNGTQVAKTSGVIRVRYDWRSFQAQKFGIEVHPLRPGLVQLSAQSLDASLPGPDHFTFWQFWVRSGSLSPDGKPTFTAKNLNTMVQSVDGTIRVAFSGPGIYYWGVSGELQGLQGRSSANGTQCGEENYWAEIAICSPGSPTCTECLPYTTPTALQVVGPSGETGNATVPSGFAGEPVLLQPLARLYQLCIITTDVTIFSGARVALPLCAPIPPSHFNRLSVRAPCWLAVGTTSGRSETFVQSNWTGGLVTTTFEVDIEKHQVYGMIPLYVTFDPTHAGGFSFSLDLALHEADTTIITSWQRLSATTAMLPELPSSVATHLIGSITWAESYPSPAAVGTELLFERGSAGGGCRNGSLTGDCSSFVDTYSRLGFNYVPQIFTEYFVPPSQDIFGVPPPLLYPTNRTGEIWQRGLRFGPMHEGFKQFFSLPDAPNASLLPRWVSPSDVEIELLKWSRALNYSDGRWPTVLDMAYDGAFFEDDIRTFCAAMKVMQPDIVFVDDEGWGGGWHSWWVERGVSRSANAQARRLHGESDLDLAVRMVMELLERWTSCLSTVSPHTRVAHYGTPFPELMMRAGILQQIGYSQVYFPRAWVTAVRRQRQHSDTLSTSVPVVPWISSCTWGQLTVDQLRGAVLHAFGSGASGFSFFRDSCIDDPGKLLALSNAMRIMRSYESIILNGSLAQDGLEYVTSQDDDSLWSGMHHPNKGLLLVLTPAKSQVNVTVKLQVSFGANIIDGTGSLAPGVARERHMSEVSLAHLTSGSPVVLYFPVLKPDDVVGFHDIATPEHLRQA